MNKKFIIVSVIVVVAPLFTLMLSGNNQPEPQKQEAKIPEITPQNALTKAKDLSTLIKSDKGSIGHVNSFNILISKIKPTDNIYNEAQILQKELDPYIKKISSQYEKEQKIKEAQLEKLNAKTQEELRKKFASKLEYNFLDNNLNIEVTTQGKAHTQLKLKYALMSKVFVHQTLKTDFAENTKKLGFKKIIFTDGYNDTWELDTSKI